MEVSGSLDVNKPITVYIHNKETLSINVDYPFNQLNWIEKYLCNQ